MKTNSSRNTPVRKTGRNSSGKKNDRFHDKETSGRSYSRKPRGNDEPSAPRSPFKRSGASRSTDEKRTTRFSRNNSDKPLRGYTRSQDGADNNRRVKKTADAYAPSRFSRNNSERPFRGRTRNDDAGDGDNKRRYRKTNEDHFSPRNSRGAEKPFLRAASDNKPFKRNNASFPRPATARKPKAPAANLSGEVRLNKFIANSGICSRREADDFITAGLVTVNGKVVTELGTKVQSGDDVRFNGERMKGEEKVYILLNKPKDFVTTTGDPHADKTVLDLIGDKCPQRIFPVGRLDKNTTGVLLLTNDGELSEQLTHPSYNKKKIYHVHLHRKVKVGDLRKLVDGVELEDGLAQADQIAYVDDNKSEVGLEIHSGRNRVVRRMFEALDYKVEKLDRVYFAGLTKKNLKRGQWRFLSEQEVNILRMGAYE